MLDRLSVVGLQSDILRIDLPPLRAERFDSKASRLEPFGPGIRRQTRLRDQMPHKRARVGKMPPNARQEQRAPLAERENKPIAIGLKRGREFGLASRRKWPRVGENRNVDAN